MISQAAKIGLKNIKLELGSKLILDNLCLSLHLQKINSLLGISGSGKTQTLQIIAGLQKSYTGEIAIDEAHTQIGYIFQSPTLIPWLSVLDNLLLSQSSKARSKIEVMAWLEKFRLKQAATKMPHELSGGMQQKINIIRAFINRPQLILMDEPFHSLDQIQKIEAYDFFKGLHSAYCPTVLMVTHDIDEALFLADHIYLLSAHKKKIEMDFTTPEKTFNSYTELKKANFYPDLYDKIFTHLSLDLNRVEK